MTHAMTPKHYISSKRVFYPFHPIKRAHYFMPKAVIYTERIVVSPISLLYQDRGKVRVLNELANDGHKRSKLHAVVGASQELEELHISPIFATSFSGRHQSVEFAKCSEHEKSSSP